MSDRLEGFELGEIWRRQGQENYFQITEVHSGFNSTVYFNQVIGDSIGNSQREKEYMRQRYEHTKNCIKCRNLPVRRVTAIKRAEDARCWSCS